MKKFIILFAALAAVLSCSKENPSNYNPVDGTYSVTLTASAPGADTKTTLVDGGAEKFVHWSKGDAIKVLFFPTHKRADKDYAGSNGAFQSEFETETSEKANFKNSAWEWGFDTEYVKIEDRLCTKGIALYPSTAVATSKRGDDGAANVTELSFILPNTQSAINGNIESELNFSYAEVDVYAFKSNSDNKKATNLTFNNACALIQLTMPTSFEKDVVSVTISSNNEVALTGKGNVEMDYWKEVILSPFKVTPEVSETSHTITLAKADGTPLEAGATYFAVVWPGAHDGLTISFNAADGTVASKSTKAVTLTASKVKPYTFNKGLDFIAPVQEFDYIYADGTTGNKVQSNIVGVVIYRGNPKEKFNDPDLPDLYCNGLAISTKNVLTAWGGSSAVSNQPADAKVAISANDIPNTKGGYTIKNIWVNNNFNLPIYNNASYADLSSCNTSGWYLGTKNEWSYIHSNLEEINALLAAAGADPIQTVSSESSTATSRNTIWMPFWCVNGSKSYYAVTAYFDVNGNLKFAYNYNYSYSRIARPIFAF